MVCARKLRYYLIEKEMTSGPCPNLLKSTHARHYSFEIDIRENFLDVRFASKANFISSSFSQKRMLWFVVNKIIFSNSSRHQKSLFISNLYIQDYITKQFHRRISTIVKWGSDHYSWFVYCSYVTPVVCLVILICKHLPENHFH